VELTDRQREILDFERTWWQLSGPKEAGIRQRLRLSPTRYYAMLTELIDHPDALAADPLLVRRLKRSRDQRRRTRYTGRPAGEPSGR
jgi:hypothetical protein